MARATVGQWHALQLSKRLGPILAMLLTSCATARLGFGSEKCGEPPASAEAFSVDKLPWMVGRFRVTFVTTSFERSTSHNELELFAADSATRMQARERRIGHRPRRDLRLVGRDYWDPHRPAESAEWDDGILYLGCRDCIDGSPDKLTISAISENGFWGRWRNDQSGFAHVLDSHGQLAPDPAGHFCARRIK